MNFDPDPVSVSSVSSVTNDNLQDAFNLDPATPCYIIDDCPFSKFSLDTLLNELTFSHKFGNRKAVYYGEYPYRYNGGSHEARDIPQGSYLSALCSYLDVLLPDYNYNSVLINYYENGDCFIPSHADLEECIEDDSIILTISLGAVRTIKFCNSISGEEAQTTNLRHGELTAMSKMSQKLFKHEILPEAACTKKRASLTFRLVKPEVPSRPPKVKPCNLISDPQSSGYVPFKDHNPTTENYPTPPKNLQAGPTNDSLLAPANVLYISSSMFRYLDTKKLSSKHVNADKLFYPGANAKVMLSKLKKDINHLTTTPSSVFIMTGTNNVDSIYYGSGSLKNTVSEMSELLRFLEEKFPNIPINVLNILPRAGRGRNDIIDELNNYLNDFCLKNKSRFKFLSTEHLFRFKDGSRRNKYFVSSTDRIRDNCHLNMLGVPRLGKFIKYWTHHN